MLDFAEQEFDTLKAHGKMPWAPVKRDTYLPRLLRRRYFKRMNALPEGPQKEAIREYFKTPGSSIDPFPVEDIGRLGRMLLDAEQQGDMGGVMGPPVPADFHWRTREEQAQIDEIFEEIEAWKNRNFTPSQREAWDKGPEEFRESLKDADPSEGPPVSYNTHNEYYDYSINMNPVAGNREDRGMGARYDPNA